MGVRPWLHRQAMQFPIATISQQLHPSVRSDNSSTGHENAVSSQQLKLTLYSNDISTVEHKQATAMTSPAK